MAAYRELSLTFDQSLLLGEILTEAEKGLYEVMFAMLENNANLTIEEKKQLIVLGRMYESCRSMRVAVTDQHGIDTESRTDFYNANRALGGLTYRSLVAVHNKSQQQAKKEDDHA